MSEEKEGAKKTMKEQPRRSKQETCSFPEAKRKSVSEIQDCSTDISFSQNKYIRIKKRTIIFMFQSLASLLSIE